MSSALVEVDLDRSKFTQLITDLYSQLDSVPGESLSLRPWEFTLICGEVSISNFFQLKTQKVSHSVASEKFVMWHALLPDAEIPDKCYPEQNQYVSFGKLALRRNRHLQPYISLSLYKVAVQPMQIYHHANVYMKCYVPNSEVSWPELYDDLMAVSLASLACVQLQLLHFAILHGRDRYAIEQVIQESHG
ncbi:MAG: hypothetical protein H6765_01025 [Candidatus Peribacteria bacterium]|nr:MAG: hypothetical protein H6765_01025 [Candidatus Peribacteria bacterium]